MNIGYEDDDLRPFVEPTQDNSDPVRIGNAQLHVEVFSSTTLSQGNCMWHHTKAQQREAEPRRCSGDMSQNCQSFWWHLAKSLAAVPMTCCKIGSRSPGDMSQSLWLLSWWHVEKLAAIVLVTFWKIGSRCSCDMSQSLRPLSWWHVAKHWAECWPAWRGFLSLCFCVCVRAVYVVVTIVAPFQLCIYVLVCFLLSRI